ncbi:MAG: hypothetical protein KKD63_16925, partial [Proteobacteria bacterium]|nr:hypothetical protein [Pseudomonadota bacterium]
RIKLADAKGFDLYFKNYLAQDGLFTPAESGLIQAMLPNLRDWYIQAGAGGMTATDTENRGAFMLGGSAADTLTGGDVTLRLGSLMLDLGNGDAVHIGSFAFEDGTVLNSNKSRRWRDGDAVADAAYWIALARTVKVGAGGMKCLAAGTARNDWAWRVAA